MAVGASGSLSELSELSDETDRFDGIFGFDAVFDFDFGAGAFGDGLAIVRFGRGFFFGFVLSALF